MAITTTAAAAITAPAAAATATVTTTAAAARGTVFLRTGDVHSQGATLEILVVKHFDRLVGLIRG